MKRILMVSSLLASIVLLALSAFNLGIFGPYMGIPFLVLAVVLSINLPKRNIFFVFLCIEFLLVIFFNNKLGTQSFLFPILAQDGYVEVINDAYCYHDDSGFMMCSLDKTDADFFMKQTFGMNEHGSILKVTRGEKYKIVSIVLGSTDLSSEIYLKTDKGFEIRPGNYKLEYASAGIGEHIFQLNKPIISKFLAIVNTPLTFVMPGIASLENTQ